MRTMLLVFLSLNVFAQPGDSFYLLKPDRVFDGEHMHTGWTVVVHGGKIQSAGTQLYKLPETSRVIELPGTTLLPGLIEGHSHLFLHPYNETSWNDQVLHESRAERTARAVQHAKASLLAGFTTVRDLGTEGAAYDDAGLKVAIEKGIVLGPRMIVATKAIVATGTYGPRLANNETDIPQGAAEVGSVPEMQKEVYNQIAHGADVIKLYTDYRWGQNGVAAPTLTIEMIRAATEIAQSSGRQTVAHATTKEGMRRAVLGGVSTIEHGDDGDEEIFKLMKDKGVALCPTLAAGDAVAQYRGWKKGTDAEPESIARKRKSFAAALKAGVEICAGGDAGVFAHGDNVRELQMMVDYGMNSLSVLQSATSVNATMFGFGKILGSIKAGLQADIIAVKGDPVKNIAALRSVLLVMKGGLLYKQL